LTGDDGDEAAPAASAAGPSWAADDDQTDELLLPYHERGWTTFEYHVSTIGKAITSSGWPQLVDVGLGVERLFERGVPLTPAALEQTLARKHFTDGTDHSLVLSLYKKTVQAMIIGARRLIYSSCDWGATEVSQFASSWFPLCDHVRHFSLATNPLGPEGARAFCDGLGDGILPNLEFLNLYNNQLGDDGLVAIAAMLERGGLPSLKVLRITGRNGVSPKGRAALRTICSARRISVEA
jgi:hypothetical protein